MKLESAPTGGPRSATRLWSLTWVIHPPAYSLTGSTRAGCPILTGAPFATLGWEGRSPDCGTNCLERARLQPRQKSSALDSRADAAQPYGGPRSATRRWSLTWGNAFCRYHSKLENSKLETSLSSPAEVIFRSRKITQSRGSCFILRVGGDIASTVRRQIRLWAGHGFSDAEQAPLLINAPLRRTSVVGHGF